MSVAFAAQAEALHHRPDQVAVMSLVSDIDAFEERAAIAQYDGGLTRALAEDLAAQWQDFAGAEAYWAWLAEYVLARKPPA